MADETPDVPAAENAEGAPTPKRRVGRPTSPKPDNAAKPARKPRTVKATVAAAEEAVSEAARKPAEAVAGAARSAVKAVKPRAAKRTTPPTRSKTKPSAKSGKSWSSAVIAGGLAVAGAAATAAMFALRSSTPKPRTPQSEPASKGKAHQPDGSDASESFAAGIADENTIPDTV